MTQVKHVLGISGGKDSAALAIYLHDKHPQLDVEYYSCDTGKELKETYELIENLKTYLGKDILRLEGVDSDKTPYDNPFDHFLATMGGFLPSSFARWCTKKLKLVPFERYVGDEPIISYVGIRGDENREGYISTKSNIQSIFPFRKNIWSKDVVKKVLANNQIDFLQRLYKEYAADAPLYDRLLEVAAEPISPQFTQDRKVNALLDLDVKAFNRVVFAFLQTTDYPLSKVAAEDFPLLDNDAIIVKKDVFRILEESGVGVPAYYEERKYEVEIDGEVVTGTYARSRSGCFFCFFQQKIEWVWLYENHPELYAQAAEYEKDGYNWQESETLGELAQTERRQQIKREHYLRMQRNKEKSKSPYLLDLIGDAEGEGCAACFI